MTKEQELQLQKLITKAEKLLSPNSDSLRNQEIKHIIMGFKMPLQQPKLFPGTRYDMHVLYYTRRLNYLVKNPKSAGRHEKHR